MYTIPRDTLLAHLRNTPLVTTLRAKRDVRDARNNLIAAFDAMEAAGISETARAEVQAKIDEYAKIGRAYGNMIEDTWGITWQVEATITHHLDLDEDDLDALPEYVKVTL